MLHHGCLWVFISLLALEARAETHSASLSSLWNNLVMPAEKAPTIHNSTTAKARATSTGFVPTECVVVTGSGYSRDMNQIYKKTPHEVYHNYYQGISAPHYVILSMNIPAINLFFIRDLHHQGGHKSVYHSVNGLYGVYSAMNTGDPKRSNAYTSNLGDNLHQFPHNYYHGDSLTPASATAASSSSRSLLFSPRSSSSSSSLQPKTPFPEDLAFVEANVFYDILPSVLPVPCPTHATCMDNKKNGDEEEVDCGGSCPLCHIAVYEVRGADVQRVNQKYRKTGLFRWEGIEDPQIIIVRDTFEPPQPLSIMDALLFDAAPSSTSPSSSTSPRTHPSSSYTTTPISVSADKEELHPFGALTPGLSQHRAVAEQGNAPVFAKSPSIVDTYEPDNPHLRKHVAADSRLSPMAGFGAHPSGPWKVIAFDAIPVPAHPLLYRPSLGSDNAMGYQQNNPYYRNNQADWQANGGVRPAYSEGNGGKVGRPEGSMLDEVGYSSRGPAGHRDPNNAYSNLASPTDARGSDNSRFPYSRDLEGPREGSRYSGQLDSAGSLNSLSESDRLLQLQRQYATEVARQQQSRSPGPTTPQDGEGQGRGQSGTYSPPVYPHASDQPLTPQQQQQFQQQQRQQKQAGSSQPYSSKDSLYNPEKTNVPSPVNALDKPAYYPYGPSALPHFGAPSPLISLSASSSLQRQNQEADAALAGVVHGSREGGTNFGGPPAFQSAIRAALNKHPLDTSTRQTVSGKEETTRDVVASDGRLALSAAPPRTAASPPAPLPSTLKGLTAGPARKVLHSLLSEPLSSSSFSSPSSSAPSSAQNKEQKNSLPTTTTTTMAGVAADNRGDTQAGLQSWPAQLIYGDHYAEIYRSYTSLTTGWLTSFDNGAIQSQCLFARQPPTYFMALESGSSRAACPIWLLSSLLLLTVWCMSA